jgi:hypothetical protein
MAGELRDYISWVHRQECAAQPCADRQIEANHSTRGRGLGQRTHDSKAFPLCGRHHRQFHDERVTGFFAGWTRDEVNRWQDEMSSKYSERYAAEQAAIAADVPAATGPAPVVPVPSSLDAFEPIVAAAEFCSAYELSAQVEHDLVRLLKRAVKAAREGKAA